MASEYSQLQLAAASQKMTRLHPLLMNFVFMRVLRAEVVEKARAERDHQGIRCLICVLPPILKIFPLESITFTELAKYYFVIACIDGWHERCFLR